MERDGIKEAREVCGSRDGLLKAKAVVEKGRELWKQSRCCGGAVL